MSPSDPQPHKRTVGILSDLSLYLPSDRRAESSARLAELPDGPEVSDAQRRALASLVAEYARSLPFALLDETQSAEFGEALCWAASNGGSVGDAALAVLRTAARSLAYETVRQHTVARLDGAGSADTAAADTAVADTAVVDTVAALPSRARVESARLLVARALRSIVRFAAPDKLEENAEILRQAVDQELPIDAEQWGKVAFMAGVYARNFPVPELSRPQLRRLWDAARWAVWYEHWFRAKYVSARINQLASLMQRLPPAVAAEIIEETAPELCAILTVAKSHAIVEISDYLESAGIVGPKALVLLADVRKRRAGLVVPAKEPDASANIGTPTAPGLVATRVREILAARLNRDEAADAIGEIWTYLDPQHNDANKDRLQRGRQGETRQFGDLIAFAC